MHNIIIHYFSDLINKTSFVNLKVISSTHGGFYTIFSNYIRIVSILLNILRALRAF